MTDTTEHPSTTPDLVPTAKRPGWPKVVGIFSIVFGSVAVTCGGLGGIAAIVMPNFMGDIMAGQFTEIPPPPMAPPATGLMIGMLGVSIIVNIVLIVAGAMTVKRAAKGRTLHLVYAVVAALLAFPAAWSQYDSQQQQYAALDAWVAEYGNTDEGRQMAQQLQKQASFQQTTGLIGLGVGVALGLAWPVFCIVWFGMVKRDPDAMGANLPDEDDLY